MVDLSALTPGQLERLQALADAQERARAEYIRLTVCSRGGRHDWAYSEGTYTCTCGVVVSKVDLKRYTDRPPQG
jgi:hypothetical protein